MCLTCILSDIVLFVCRKINQPFGIYNIRTLFLLIGWRDIGGLRQESQSFRWQRGGHGMHISRYVTFDAHVHVMSRSRLESGWRWLQQQCHDDVRTTGKPPTPKSLMADLAGSGIQGCFNFFFAIFPRTSRVVNEWNDRFCSGNAGVLPFLTLHPHDTSGERSEMLNEFILNRHFAGVKIHSFIQDIRLDAEWMHDVCAFLAKNRRILYLHTGFSATYRNRYHEEEMARDLATLLSAFPGLTVVAAHMFYPRLDLAFRLLNTFPNLYLDTTGLISTLEKGGDVGRWLPSWEEHAERIMFGSDAGLNPASILEEVRLFEELAMSEQALRRIGGETAWRLVEILGLSRDGMKLPLSPANIAKSA